MPRIPYIQTDDVEESIAQAWKEGLDSALSHMNAHAQGLYAPMNELNRAVTALGGPCRLDNTQRELVAVRAALLCGCRYIAAMHMLAALGHGGANDAQVAAVNDGDIASDAFDDAQKLVLKFTTEIVENATASDETVSTMREIFTDRQIIEFTILIGSRMTLCQVANVGGVSLEDNPQFHEMWKDAHYAYPYRGLNGDPLGGGHS